ncbi:MAG: proline--tRNA ligase [Bdellovibrio sp.]
MKLSNAFWQTYKENPAEAEIPSHRLMLRAGLIQKSAAGIYNYLPFGYRVVRKIEKIVREEMDRIGCQELLMSVVTPGELWQESKRWDVMGDEMLKFKDKAKRDLCISPTNEEAVVDIFRKTIKSYKQLPVTLYQINTKFRDEIRPRFGLMRGREFTMKDAYSFHATKQCLDKVYNDLYGAYEAVLKRINLEYIAVEADAGNMGSSDSKTHEFQVIADTGEDKIVYSSEEKFAANIEKAQTKRAHLSIDYSDKKITEIATPGKSTIEDVCQFLKIEQSHSLKNLLYSSVVGDKEEFILAIILGDDELNEVKLKNLLGSTHLTMLSDAKIEELGFVKGFIGPIGINKKVKIVIDEHIDTKGYYVVGANKKDYHLTGFNFDRDCKVDLIKADLRLAKEGDLTPSGKSKVTIRKGIEVGHIFQLGDKYTKAMSSTVLDQNGKAFNPLMGCYGIGITRLAAAAIEQHHDEKGIKWPKAIAPYHIYLTSVGKDPEIAKLAEKYYMLLQKEGFEVILDDRNVGPGFKFNDAELLGLPIRVVIGERDFKERGEIEIGLRQTNEKVFVTENDLIQRVKTYFESAK